MKKLISLSLAILFVLLAFAGCSKAPTKEELLDQAVEADALDVSNEAFENLVAAKQKYCDKVLKLKGRVDEIKEDCIIVGKSTEYRFQVYLPEEDMVNLKTGQEVCVVGKTTDEIIDVSDTLYDVTFNYHNFQMPNAYLVQDVFEFTGILKGENKSYSPAFNVQIGESNILRIVYFADSVDTSKFTYGQEIKFKAKCIYENSNYHYYNAEIIE